MGGPWVREKKLVERETYSGGTRGGAVGRGARRRWRQAGGDADDAVVSPSAGSWIDELFIVSNRKTRNILLVLLPHLSNLREINGVVWNSMFLIPISEGWN